MADRGAARLQVHGSTAQSLGASTGGGLLRPRSSHLQRSLALPAIAADDRMHPVFRGAWPVQMDGEASTMRFASILPGVLLLAVALVVSWRLLGRLHARIAKWRKRPAVLRDADLICVESQFTSKSRWPIVARVERAYRLPSGLVALVELKTRSTAAGRTSDVIPTQSRLAQLSGLSRQTLVGLAAGALSDLGFNRVAQVLAVLRLELDLPSTAGSLPEAAPVDGGKERCRELRSGGPPDAVGHALVSGRVPEGYAAT